MSIRMGDPDSWETEASACGERENPAHREPARPWWRWLAFALATVCAWIVYRALVGWPGLGGLLSALVGR